MLRSSGAPGSGPKPSVILESPVSSTPLHPTHQPIRIYPDSDHSSPSPGCDPRPGPYHLSPGLWPPRWCPYFCPCSLWSIFNTAEGMIILKYTSDHVAPLLKNPSCFPCHSCQDLLSLPPPLPSEGPCCLPCISLLQPHWPVAAPHTCQTCPHLRAFALALPATWNTRPLPQKAPWPTPTLPFSLHLEQLPGVAGPGLPA